MKVQRILVSQPQPAILEKSPFYDITEKHRAVIDYKPFIKVVGVTLKEFRAQRTEILDHTAVIFTNRTTIDSFFHICEEARVTVPEGMKYFCMTEAVALYLQKYIVYRKRKIFFANGSYNSFMELILKHKDERFLLTLSEPHKPEIPMTFDKLKLKHSKVVLSKTVSADLDNVKLSDYDILAFYSPSEISTLVSTFGTASLPMIAVFGESTAKAAADAGISVRAMAPTPEAPSMVKALDMLLTRLENGEEIEAVKVEVASKAEEFIKAQEAKPLRKARKKVGGSSAKSTAASTSNAKKSSAAKPSKASAAGAKTATGVNGKSKVNDKPAEATKQPKPKTTSVKTVPTKSKPSV